MIQHFSRILAPKNKTFATAVGGAPEASGGFHVHFHRLSLRVRSPQKDLRGQGDQGTPLPHGCKLNINSVWIRQ